MTCDNTANTLNTHKGGGYIEILAFSLKVINGTHPTVLSVNLKMKYLLTFRKCH